VIQEWEKGKRERRAEGGWEKRVRREGGEIGEREPIRG
jgi:hypothetical protein